jgi:NitT/TauT family transport system substrate-binding protein
MNALIARLSRALVAGAICLSLVPAPLYAQGAQIIVAGPPNDSGGPMFYAQDLGLYEKAGLNVKIQALNNPGPVAAAVVGGSVTIGTLTVPAVALAREKGIPLVIIAPGSIYNSATPTSGIIVLKSSKFTKASDLNGATIATRDLSNLSYYGAKAWMDKNGGDSSSIKWLEIPDPQTVPAMIANRVDAASVSEPALDSAIHGPDARLLGAVYDAIGDKFMISAYFTTEEYARTHPEIIRKFAEVIVNAGIWANKNRAQSAKILEKYSGVAVPPNATRVTYAERMRAADIQPILTVLTQYKLLKEGTRPGPMFATGAVLTP